MKVGPGWIPDFLEAALDEDANLVRLTLIELEAVDATARASCRKYLPESTNNIFHAFVQYLDNVLAQCRATADPRLVSFQSFRDKLENAYKVSIRTAGALRDSVDFLEEFPLLDSTEDLSVSHATKVEKSVAIGVLEGHRKMSRAEIDCLKRVVRILHAVLFDSDHSKTSFDVWRKSRNKPLDSALKSNPALYPGLRKLVLHNDQSGSNVDCEQVFDELTVLWKSNLAIRGEARDCIRHWVAAYYPFALKVTGHKKMQVIFDDARHIINNEQQMVGSR